MHHDAAEGLDMKCENEFIEYIYTHVKVESDHERKIRRDVCRAMCKSDLPLGKAKAEFALAFQAAKKAFLRLQEEKDDQAHDGATKVPSWRRFGPFGDDHWAGD